MDKTEDHDTLKNKIIEGQQIMDNLSVDKHVTEEEFQNFMHRVTEVGKYYFDYFDYKHNFRFIVIFLRKNCEKIGIFQS